MEMIVRKNEDLNREVRRDLARVLNKAVYDGHCSPYFMFEHYISDPDMLHFTFATGKVVMADFIIKELPDVNAAHYVIGGVLEAHRRKGIYGKAIAAREDHCRKLGFSHVVTRTSNPLIISILEKHGYYYPKATEMENGALIERAREIVTEYCGKEIDDYMILKGTDVESYPCLTVTGSSPDHELKRFMDETMNIERGDRLVLIKALK